jgi:hypothetical protein
MIVRAADGSRKNDNASETNQWQTFLELAISAETPAT